MWIKTESGLICTQTGNRIYVEKNNAGFMAVALNGVGFTYDLFVAHSDGREHKKCERCLNGIAIRLGAVEVGPSGTVEGVYDEVNLKAVENTIHEGLDGRIRALEDRFTSLDIEEAYRSG